MPKHIRDLATLTCSKLQAKKSSQVEVICSSKIDPNLMGIFYNSFHLTNYEWSLKSHLTDSEDKPLEDKRLESKSKLIDEFELCHEQDLASC